MNDDQSKIGHDFRNKLFLKLNLSKNAFNKSWCPKLMIIFSFWIFSLKYQLKDILNCSER